MPCDIAVYFCKQGKLRHKSLAFSECLRQILLVAVPVFSGFKCFFDQLIDLFVIRFAFLAYYHFINLRNFECVLYFTTVLEKGKNIISAVRKSMFCINLIFMDIDFL